MKKLILLLLACAFAFPIFSSSNPLSEDLNGNGIPDIVEIQKSTINPPVLGVGTITDLALIVLVIFVVLVGYLITKSREYGDVRDITVKIFKSKYRRVIA